MEEVNTTINARIYFELQNLKFQTGEFNKDFIALKLGGKNYRKFNESDQKALEKFWFRRYVDVIGSINPFKKIIHVSRPELVFWSFKTVNNAFAVFHNLDYSRDYDSECLEKRLKNVVDSSDELRWLLDEWDGNLKTFWKTEVLDKTERIWTLEELKEVEGEQGERLGKIQECLEKIRDNFTQE